METLARALTKMSSLKSLDLFNSKIGNKGVAILADALVEASERGAAGAGDEAPALRGPAEPLPGGGLEDGGARGPPPPPRTGAMAARTSDRARRAQGATHPMARRGDARERRGEAPRR